jgi:putative addiction module killer protein
VNVWFEIREYTQGGRSPFAEWFDNLDSVTAARVDRYIRRLESGNFGAAKVVGEGVSELRLDFGPGYRVYFGRDGKTLVILLGGGSKRRQDADIAAAIARWKRYQQAKKEK